MYFVTLQYEDHTDSENPQLINQRLAAHGDLADHYFREYLHFNLAEIIRNFRRMQDEEPPQ